MLSGEAKVASLDFDGILKIRGRVYVPRVGGWVRLILDEAHCSRYVIHPRVTKMYYDLKHFYW